MNISIGKVRPGFGTRKTFTLVGVFLFCALLVFNGFFPSSGGIKKAHAAPVTITFYSDDYWQVPAGVTSVTIDAWGGGGGGNSIGQGGYGGGGGGYAHGTVSVTPGNYYDIIVGQGGVAGEKNGGAGGPTYFGGGDVGATGGDGGQSGIGPGVGGNIFAGDFGYSGGQGGYGDQFFSLLGGGGGGGAGSSGAGSTGDDGINGGAGGAGGPSEGGQGGHGGDSRSDGEPGYSIGGGGGGSGDGSFPGDGAAGQLWVTYIPPLICTSITSGSGNWNSASTWTNCGGGTPGSNDTAVIEGTAQITVTASTTVNNLQFGDNSTPATNAVLKVNSGQTLTVSNTTTVFSASNNNVQATIQDGTGSGTVSGVYLDIGSPVIPGTGSHETKLISSISNFSLAGSTTMHGYSGVSRDNDPTLEIPSGTMTTTSLTTTLSASWVTATISMNTGAQTGTLKLTSNPAWSISGTGTTNLNLAGTGNTVEYSGTNASILNTTYKNLKVSGALGTTAQTATVAGAFTVTGSGSMSPSSGTMTFNNGASINNSGTLNFYNLSTSVFSSVSSSGSFGVASGGTFTIGGASTFTPAAGDVITGTSATITGSGTAKVTRTAATADFNTQYNFGTKTLTNLTVDYAGSGQSLSNLTYGGLKVSGSITGATATATVGTNFNVTGTFTPSAGTITMSGTSSITNSGTLTFINLIINTLASVTGNTSFGVSGTFTENSGASFAAASGTQTFNNGSSIVKNSTQLLQFNNLTVAASGTITANVDMSINSAVTVLSSGTWNATAGTVTMMDGSSISNAGTLSFQNLTIGAGGTTNVTANASYTVKGGWTISSNATLSSSSGTVTLTASGTPFVMSGSFSPSGTNTVKYASSTGATVTSNISYQNLDISPSSGTPTFSVGFSNLSVGGDLTLTGTVATTFNLNNIASYLDVNGNVSINSGNTLVAPPSSAIFYIGGNYTNSGTLNNNVGTIQFDAGTTGKTITTNNQFFNNLVFNNASGGWTYTPTLYMSGTLTVTAGTLSGTGNVETDGGNTTGNGTINITGGTFSQYAGGSFGGNTNWTFNDIQFGDDISEMHATGTGTITARSISSLYEWHAGSKTWIITGTGTPLTNNGTFFGENSTFQFTGSTVTVPVFAYNNLTLGGSGTYTMPASTLTLTGNLTVTNGATVTKGAGTVVFGGSTPQTITDNSGTKQDLGALQVSNTTQPWCNISSTVCNSSWLNRRKITFNNSASSANLTNFPVLVQLTSANIDYNKTKANGADLRFVDADGTTALSYQIETWNTSGTSNIWVRVPQVNNTTTDYIYMYYNNTGAVDSQAATSVWDSNFKGVWHLPDGGTLSTADSTSNANNGTNQGSTIAAAGKIGGGANFINSGSDLAISNISVSGVAYTISTWFNTPFGNAGSYTTLTRGAAGDHQVLIDPSNILGVFDSSTGFYSSGFNVTSLSSGWHHLTASATGSTTTFYIDGVSVGSSLFKSNTNISYLGNCGVCSGQRWGLADEMRVSTGIARDANWAKADYLSESNQMNTFGSEESSTAVGVALGSSIKATSVTVDATRVLSANGSNTLTLVGNGASVFVVNGTFVPSTGTVDFSSASTTGTTVPGTTFYNLTLNKASNNFTSGGSMTVGGTLTISAGTFTAPSGTLTLNGDLVNSGTFTHNSGTVVFAPTNASLSSTISGSSNITFNNVSDTTPGSSIIFKNGSTFIFSGTLTATGTAQNAVWLKSASPGSQWTVTFSSTPSLTNVSVQDGACNGGLTLAQNPSLHNEGRNGSCWGFIIYTGGGGASDGGSGNTGGESGGGGGSGGGTTISFTSSGSWTAPEGVTSVIVEAWGGGAGAGRGTTIGGSGGGGGAYSKKNSISVTAGTTYTVTVGTGGAGSTGGNAQAGGDSWFSTSGTILAKGGTAGADNGGAVGTGGAAGSGIGDVKFSGANGGTGSSIIGGGGGGGGGAGTGTNGNPGDDGVSGGGGGKGGALNGGAGGDGQFGSTGGAGSVRAGGGGGGQGAGSNGGAGARGEIRITYTVSGGSGGSSTSGNTTTFTSTGSWTAPAGVTSVTVEAWGAGGSSASGSSGGAGRGGGGGGAYSSATITVTPGNQYTVTVGTGGAGRSCCSVLGQAGGDSWFGTTGTLLAKGGSGGDFSGTGASGGAAAAGVGTIKFSGGAGGNSADNTASFGGGGGGGAGTTANGGNGGNSSGVNTVGAAGTGGSLNGGNGGIGGTGAGSVRGGGGGGANGATDSVAGGRGEVRITINATQGGGGGGSP